MDRTDEFLRKVNFTNKLVRQWHYSKCLKPQQLQISDTYKLSRFQLIFKNQTKISGFQTPCVWNLNYFLFEFRTCPVSLMCRLSDHWLNMEMQIFLRFCLTSLPRNWAPWKSALTTSSRWLLKSVTTAWSSAVKQTPLNWKIQDRWKTISCKQKKMYSERPKSERPNIKKRRISKSA